MIASTDSPRQSPPLPLEPLQRRILSAVARRGGLSRGGIARELHLSRSNLSPVIVRLVNDGLLTSVGQDASRGGRRGDLLGLAGPTAAVVAGLELDVDRLRVVVTGLAVSSTSSIVAQVDVRPEPAQVLERASATVQQLLEPHFGPLVAVGVSLPAAIDIATGSAVVAPAMPDWVGFRVVDWLAERLSTRVFVESDLNALALAEMTAPHKPSLGIAVLVVKARDGIGCGIVINDELFRGSQGSAGEIGHTCIDANEDTICACGLRGCLEALIAPANLAVRARQLSSRERSPILGPALDASELRMQTIGEAVTAGDPLALALMREIGLQIGQALATAISFFNPSSVVISTGGMPGTDVLMGAIQTGVYARAFPGATRRLQLVESGLGEDAVAVGAAVLARDGFFGTAARTIRQRHPVTPVDS